MTPEGRCGLQRNLAAFPRAVTDCEVCKQRKPSQNMRALHAMVGQLGLNAQRRRMMCRRAGSAGPLWKLILRLRPAEAESCPVSGSPARLQAGSTGPEWAYTCSCDSSYNRTRPAWHTATVPRRRREAFGSLLFTWWEGRFPIPAVPEFETAVGHDDTRGQ